MAELCRQKELDEVTRQEAGAALLSTKTDDGALARSPHSKTTAGAGCSRLEEPQQKRIRGRALRPLQSACNQNNEAPPVWMCLLSLAGELDPRAALLVLAKKYLAA